MPACRTILQHLRDHTRYLLDFHECHRAARFEELICQGFGGLLRLPYSSAADNEQNSQYRVSWLGSPDGPVKAPPHRHDGIAWAPGFCLLIEATMKPGSKQWMQEFAPCIDHANAILAGGVVKPEDLYVVLVTAEIHKYTWQTVSAHNAANDTKIVVMEPGHLGLALETSVLAWSIRQVETRKLLQHMIDQTGRTRSFPAFREAAANCVSDWQRQVLELERQTVLAVRSYAAMLKQGRGYVGTSEILARLTRDPVIKCYVNKLNGKLDTDSIANSLIQESLGVKLVTTPNGEALFSPVSLQEFQSRCGRRLRAVQMAGR